MTTRSKKPKCDGKTSQSCGMSCISREDTCREAVAADVATRLVELATQYKQANDASGQSFDAVMGQFPPKLLKEAHRTGVATSDLGNGAVLTTKEAVGLDGSSIKYGFVTDTDGKRYTVSDGLVKEVTGAAGSEWDEAFQAAVRSKIAVNTSEPTAMTKAVEEAVDKTKEDLGTSGGLASLRATKKVSAGRKFMSEDEVLSLEAEIAVELKQKKIAINIDPENLIKVLTSGRFKSQFETGTSGGELNAKVRAEAEGDRMSYETDTEPAMRPIYATLSDPNGPTGGAQYGSLVVELKPETKDRSTFTVGDSLDYTNTGATPVNSPKLESFGVYENETDRGDVLKQYLKKQFNKVLSETYGYLEAQVHGGVSTTDIASVTAAKDAKIPDQLKKLLSDSGIKLIISD